MPGRLVWVRKTPDGGTEVSDPVPTMLLDLKNQLQLRKRALENSVDRMVGELAEIDAELESIANYEAWAAAQDPTPTPE